MIKLRYITLFATIMLLSSCGAGVTIKDATGFIAGQVITNSGDSDVVSVYDARVKHKQVVVPQQNSKDWNNTSDTVTTTTQSPVTTPQVRVDKTSTLYWFFFSMMIMGMLGAGIIGIIEAFSGRNSLSTEQAERTAPIIKKSKPKAKPKPTTKTK